MFPYDACEPGNFFGGCLRARVLGGGPARAAKPEMGFSRTGNRCSVPWQYLKARCPKIWLDNMYN